MTKNVKALFVSATDPIITAMKIIESDASKIALVVNADFKLLGTVTDGDVRRGLINNISVNDHVQLIMNKQPKSFLQETPWDQIEKVMKEKKITQIPLLNKEGVVVDIVLSSDLESRKIKPNTVILMAGGLGQRLGELTMDCPKPMLKVGDKPILEVVLNNLKEHGFHDFVISVNYKAEIIENHFKDGSDFGVTINYIREKERLGTAGALSLFKPKNDLPLLVMNGDVLTKVDFTQFLNNHNKNNYQVSMCVRKYDLQVPFGVVNVNEQTITSIIEKPVQSFFINAGVYILDKKVLDLIPEQTYFDMPSLFNQVIAQSKASAGVFPIHEYWMDVGQRDDFNQAQLDFKKVF